MTRPSALPASLEEILEGLDLLTDRADRIAALIDLADRFREVPPEVATRPFPEANRVPSCESEVFVWVRDRADGTLQLDFAVDNPQGVSAKALAGLLGRSLSGLPPEEVARVPPDVVYRIFGSELSMGKSMGLMAMVSMVQAQARKRLR